MPYQLSFIDLRRSERLGEVIVGIRVGLDGEYFQFFQVIGFEAGDLTPQRKIDLVIQGVRAVVRELREGRAPLSDPSQAIDVLAEPGDQGAKDELSAGVRATLESVDLAQKYVVGPTLLTWSPDGDT